MIENRINKTSKCIACHQWIDMKSIRQHILTCIGHKDSVEQEREAKFCHECEEKLLTSTDRRLVVHIGCSNNHHYCWSCFHKSLCDYVKNDLSPVCHRNKCDYSLSIYELSLIPMERHLSDRLVQLARGKQRPKCSKCQFYIDCRDSNDLHQHMIECQELIPCEFCCLPYAMNKLEEHSLKCRLDSRPWINKWMNFIQVRCKYPLTKRQICHVLERNQYDSSMQPHALISQLAELGPVFPYELSTIICPICLEPIDDTMFTSNCSYAHQYCHRCFSRSCQLRFEANELLICVLCREPLKEVDIDQLDFENVKDLNKFRQYQSKKLFDTYSKQTRGIIQCPNRDCSWIAEAQDPNERFPVRCPLCFSEFCSLCHEAYHYRTSCHELPQLKQRWLFYRQQMDDALIEDELYKAEHCRHCPRCHRIIQRIEGCNTIICGQDAHGGNIQSGCGLKFDWTLAQPYRFAFHQKESRNIGEHKQQINCDHCQKRCDQGLRFECVHCPALVFCADCERQATVTHFHDKNQHIFRLITE